MKTKIIVAAAAATLLSGCASILSDNSYPVTFDSAPSGAMLKITDEAGNVMFDGKGPTTITLNSGNGFFDGASYTIAATLDGETATNTLSPSLDGWYIGNILFGGLIGLLIVDPATGAMYKLPDRFTVNVPVEGVATSADASEGQRVQVLSMNDVPEELRGELVAVN